MKNNNIFDLLPIGQFIFYYIIGLYNKNNYFNIFIARSIWEVFLYFITKNLKVRELLIKYSFIPRNILNKKILDKKIRDSFSDVGFYMLGYHLGNITN